MVPPITRLDAAALEQAKAWRRDLNEMGLLATTPPSSAGGVGGGPASLGRLPKRRKTEAVNGCGAVNTAPEMAAINVAVRRGLGAVNKLLAWGANPNQVLAGGGTALHVAAQRGAHEIVYALLVSGGCADAVDSKGESPLIKAVRFGHSHVVKVLLGAGCDVGIRAWRPRCHTALDVAAGEG